MEVLVLLIFILPIALIVFVIADPLKGSRERKANKKWDDWLAAHEKNPKKYKQYTKEEKRHMSSGGSIENIGNRGGRYEERISKKTGRPYRHYF